MHTFKESLKPQQRDHPVPMRFVRICKQPEPAFRRIDRLHQLSQRGVGRQHVLERERIVDFAVVFQRIDFVVTDEAVDRQSVLFVIVFMKVLGVFRR